MQEEISKDSSVKFYLVSDDLDEKRKLKEIFGKWMWLEEIAYKK